MAHPQDLTISRFGPDRVMSYVKSQRQLLTAIEDKAIGQSASRGLPTPTLFTLGDTIIIAVETVVDKEYDAVKGFAKIVRSFIADSLTKTLFFRGAFSIGSYFVSEAQNLVMGDAVTDAASWHEQLELIGAVATPKASMIIQQHVLQDLRPPDFLLFQTEIPCKQGPRTLFAVNWPKAFYVPGLRPHTCREGHETSCLLSLLAANEVPIGTEHKYTNTIAFFENAPCQQDDGADA